jgi:hypothetical protein
MVDMGAIASAVTGLKTAADIAKSIFELKVGTEVQGKVIELQSVILGAQSSAIAGQSEQYALLEKIRELTAKLAALEAWETEQERYQLTDFGGGTLVYVLKPDRANGEPSHRLCPACFQNGNKSILQNRGGIYGGGREIWDCPACKHPFKLGAYRP